MNTRLYAAGIAALVFSACGAYAPKRSSYHSGSAGNAGGAPSGPAQPSADSSAPSSAPSGAYTRSSGHLGTSRPYQHRHVEQRRAKQERPGLGTVWGENVHSTVTTRPFVRKSSRPFATAAMYYNDAEGVSAHAAYRGGARALPVYAYTPHQEITISLTDQYGRVLHGLQAGGRTLVTGTAGQRYNIVIQNRTNGRFEIVASVDGLDVIDGRPADVNKRGYILEPYGRLVIDGFRRSDNYVAAFRFGSVRNSYAARTGRGRNVGVVGVALFDEQGSAWTVRELQRRDTANPFPGDYARPPY